MDHVQSRARAILSQMHGAAKAAVSQLPNAPGVYRFRDAADRVLYIGRAVNLRRRVGSYWSNPSGRLRTMVSRIARIQAVWCESEHEAAWLERNLLERGLPRWNKTPGGQEVPVFIRLDWHAGTPGVSVVHDLETSAESRHFGPYLGGAKVRLAAAGLHRVMPLAYTGLGLSGAEYDMARVLRVDPRARPVLVDELSAVLERNPAAVASVRKELISRRDSAAESLDFERAARVQAELDALEWVVSEQTVTRMDTADFDVCGWSSGILVRFEVRGGRLCGWRQRLCSEVAAKPQVASTPAEWSDFAQRNADLAARLALP